MRYEFLIEGGVPDEVKAEFPQLKVARVPGADIALFGHVRDRAALRGLLARFDDLGLNVIEMRQLPGDPPQDGGLEPDA